MLMKCASKITELEPTMLTFFIVCREIKAMNEFSLPCIVITLILEKEEKNMLLDSLMAGM